ncbi:UNVERIFIED_CONTAM: hypothetical protein Slati_0871800 [Sesamum latifolium]|uniref:Uncharacterized protein n=1 Tax=Sesamum latifolium TaxID=2727402 RepID=A0AAW2XRE1_9LAMI
MQTSFAILDCRTILPFPLPSPSKAIGVLKALAVADFAPSFFLFQRSAFLPFTLEVESSQSDTDGADSSIVVSY